MSVYHKSVTGTAAFREAYLQSLARTVYPYVPEVYSVTASTLTMEKIEGFTLAQHLMRDGYRHLRVLITNLEIIRERLHSIGLIHNDAHCGNIIIESGNVAVKPDSQPISALATGNMYLIDFGTSYLIHGMPNVRFTDGIAMGHHGDHIEAEAVARFDTIYMSISIVLYSLMSGRWSANYDSPRDLLLEDWPPVPTQYLAAFNARIRPIFDSDEDMIMADYRRVLDIFMDIVESTPE